MNNPSIESTINHLSPEFIKSFLDFELKVSRELQKISSLSDLVHFLKQLFESDKIEIWFYDDINTSLRLINETQSYIGTYITTVFNILNERNPEFPYIIHSVEEGNKVYTIHHLQPTMALLNTKETLPHSLILPVLNETLLDGFIVIHNPQIAIDQDNLLNISLLLSLTANIGIVNRYLDIKRHIDVSVPLLNATVEIAKIIENQHELKFVIPLIGEIVDKNIESSLVYIFIRDQENLFKLNWPNAYDAKFINPLISAADQRKTTIISNDKRAAVYPLIEKGNLFGVIVSDAKIGKISEHDLEFLQKLSEQASITISRCLYLCEIEKHAVIDALTGLDNRRQLDRRYLQEASLSIRIKKPLSLLLMDIDHFKKINDSYGHSAGDYILRSIAKILKQQARESDTLGRYGGEEFCAVLPNTSLEGAQVIAERIRKSIEDTSFDLSTFSRKGSKNTKITMSIGISEFTSHGTNPADVIEEADIALYRAKDKGRNRVELFQSSY